jgi:hypothetical protein
LGRQGTVKSEGGSREREGSGGGNPEHGGRMNEISKGLGRGGKGRSKREVGGKRIYLQAHPFSSSTCVVFAICRHSGSTGTLPFLITVKVSDVFLAFFAGGLSSSLKKSQRRS